MIENERKEAIRIIKSECYISDLLDFDRTRMVNTALDMAVKALETPPSDDWEKYSDRLWKEAYERGKAEVSDRVDVIIKELEFAVKHHEGIEKECYQRSLNLVRQKMEGEE